MNTNIILGNKKIYKIHQNKIKSHYIQTIVTNKNKLELLIDNPDQYEWIKDLFKIEFEERIYLSYLKKISQCKGHYINKYPKPFNLIDNYKMIHWLYINFNMVKIKKVVKQIIEQIIINIEKNDEKKLIIKVTECNLIINKFKINLKNRNWKKYRQFMFFTDIQEHFFVSINSVLKYILLPCDVTLFDYMGTFNELTHNLFKYKPISGHVISDGFFYEKNKSWSRVVIIHSDTYKFHDDNLDYITFSIDTGRVYYVIDYDICIFVFEKNTLYTSFSAMIDNELCFDSRFFTYLHNNENTLLVHNNSHVYQNSIIKINKTNNKSMLLDVVNTIDMSYFQYHTKKEIIRLFAKVYIVGYIKKMDSNKQ